MTAHEQRAIGAGSSPCVAPIAPSLANGDQDHHPTPLMLQDGAERSGELVVLVDRDDNEVGRAPKYQAHRDGALHRAFSVFLVDDNARVLLQRRALGKYHSGGLWSNTCCGHPRPGESVNDAAHRRLREEMGIFCALTPIGRFIYRAPLGNGLVEHELDHVFVGRFLGAPAPDPSEVAAWRWEKIDDLIADHAARPARYTAWTGPALGALLSIGMRRRDVRRPRDSVAEPGLSS